MPLLTKNTGMRKPNPIASSLVRKRGWLAESRSTMLTTTPARNAPRMLSSPNRSASAVNAMSSTTANRTRISAVVSCSRSSTSPSARHADRPHDDTTTPAIPTRTANADDQHEAAAGAAVRCGEEQRQQHDRGEVGDGRGDDRLSARPRRRDWPASLSTGTTSPSDVADSAIDQQQRAAAPSRRRRAPSPIGTPRASVITIAEQRERAAVGRAAVAGRSPARTGTAGTPARSAPGSAPAGRPSPSRAPTGRARCR